MVLERLAAAAAMDRIWFGLGATPAEEKAIADTAPGQPLPVPAWQIVLQRSPGDEPARWVRTHVATAMARRKADRATVHRVRVEASGEALGSVWALRAREQREPDRAETRILSAAADQLGQAIVRDRADLERTDAEIARRSEALKTALLDSVSHDLRTPLATIRAAAGSMLDESVAWTAQDQRSTPRPNEWAGSSATCSTSVGSKAEPSSRSSSRPISTTWCLKWPGAPAPPRPSTCWWSCPTRCRRFWRISCT
jgi:signal transduction histidine kinase